MVPLVALHAFRQTFNGYVERRCRERQLVDAALIFFETIGAHIRPLKTFAREYDG